MLVVAPVIFLKNCRKRILKKFTLIGVDLSKNLVKYSKDHNLGHYFCVCSLDAIPFRHQSFTITSINFVFHHLPIQIHEIVLEELIRVTKKNILIRDVCSENTLIGRLFKIYWKILDGGTKYRTCLEWEEFLKYLRYQGAKGSYPDWICNISL